MWCARDGARTGRLHTTEGGRDVRFTHAPGASCRSGRGRPHRRPAARGRGRREQRGARHRGALDAASVRLGRRRPRRDPPPRRRREPEAPPNRGGTAEDVSSELPDDARRLAARARRRARPSARTRSSRAPTATGRARRRAAPRPSASSTTPSAGRCSRARSRSRSSARRWRTASGLRSTRPASRRRRCATSTGRPPAPSRALADPAVKPADLAQTTTLDGRTVDYIVRIEKGVIDRGVYEIAALYDPAAPPSPFTDEPGWNGKARLHVRRRLQRRLPPGAGERRRAHRPLPRARLRRRVVVPERLRQQLQRGDLGRGRADGEGALRRDVREAEVTRSAAAARAARSSST